MNNFRHTYPETLQTNMLPECERDSDWQRQNIVGNNIEEGPKLLTP